MRASSPTMRPTELRARCGCRFEPILVEGEYRGTLEQTSICIPHSVQRTNRLLREDDNDDNPDVG